MVSVLSEFDFDVEYVLPLILTERAVESDKADGFEIIVLTATDKLFGSLPGINEATRLPNNTDLYR